MYSEKPNLAPSLLRRLTRRLGLTWILSKVLAFASLELNELGFADHVSRRSHFIDPNFIREQIYNLKRGVLHIGAHRGQEAPTYASTNNKVLWVEAIEDICRDLEQNLEPYPNQKAILALLGDREQMVEFNISNNDGVSSSIHRFTEESNLGINMNSTRKLKMTRLDSILTPSQMEHYSHWVLDVQGSELAVLRGAGSLLDHCKSLDIEVTTYDLYEGGTRFEDLDLFLRDHGFLPMWGPREHSHEDIIYIRLESRRGNTKY